MNNFEYTPEEWGGKKNKLIRRMIELEKKNILTGDLRDRAMVEQLYSYIVEEMKGDEKE